MINKINKIHPLYKKEWNGGSPRNIGNVSHYLKIGNVVYNSEGEKKIIKGHDGDELIFQNGSRGYFAHWHPSNSLDEQKLRKAIRKRLFECMDEMSMQYIDEQMIDEERIPNDEAKEFVKKTENFVGSHIWGEKLGDDYYLVASYGEQFPLFIYDRQEDNWYENGDDYVYNGENIDQTKEHRELLRPSVDMHIKSLEWMLKKLSKIKSTEGIGNLSHTSVEPGEKN